MIQRLTSSLEDYLEAIYILSRQALVVRSKDIARKLGVSMPSVTEAMQKLAEMDLISYEKYSYITLTPKGVEVAEKIYSQHRILFQFFRDILRMEVEIAETDACKMEHHASSETLRRLKRFVEFIKSYSEAHPNWLELLLKKLEHQQERQS